MQEKDAGLDQPPVPRDHLLKPRFKFPTPVTADVVRAFEVAHSLAEVQYAGDGCWDCPGDYTNDLRGTSNRVLAYISAFRVFGSELYKTRALEGLGYLLRMQCEEGDFPWFHNSYRGVRNRDDGLFEAGMSGRALVEGYKLTGDDIYLQTSWKAAKWEMDCPPSANNNYNMLSVWHLAAHYEVAPDPAVLDAAIEKTRLGGMPDQLPAGGWPGHNSWMWYHGIMVRGMAELLRVLPQEHPFRPELVASLTAAINRAIREQVASGEVPPNPRVKRAGHTCSFLLHGLLLARESLGDAVGNCIHGIMRYRLLKTPDAEFVRRFAGTWNDYLLRREAARAAATGEVMWRAGFERFVNDVEWGEVAPGAVNCWYPCNDFDPAHQQWRRATSARTGGSAQQITSRGAKLFGGMGWTVSRGTLAPGRRYRFTASVSCSGNTSNMPLLIASAWSGKKRDEWDPFTGCVMTRENPTYDSYSEISVAFTAGSGESRVYVWTAGREIGPGETVSITVDEAKITDAGLSLPDWDPALDSYDAEPYMSMLPTAVYLEQYAGGETT